MLLSLFAFVHTPRRPIPQETDMSPIEQSSGKGKKSSKVGLLQAATHTLGLDRGEQFAAESADVTTQTPPQLARVVQKTRLNAHLLRSHEVRQLQRSLGNRAVSQLFAQRDAPQPKAKNETGLSDTLKAGIENLSGYSMDDVKVHFNSEKPAQLQAHAYAQGTDIHVASGQEKYLPHEAWHVVQQKQGRVKPTVQLKGEININDDPKLEKEADVMGQNALQATPQHLSGTIKQTGSSLLQQPVLQGMFDVTNDEDMIGKRVVVSADKYKEYGETGEIVRRSSKPDKWTVKMEGSGKHVRFSYEELSLAAKTPELIEADAVAAEVPDQAETDADAVMAEVPDQAEANMDAVAAEVPDQQEYRLHKSKGENDDWVRLHLTKQNDDTLVDNNGTKYQLLSIRHGADAAFVSLATEKQAPQPTKEFIGFLEEHGFESTGTGTIQDRLHLAVVEAHRAGETATGNLINYLRIPANGKWYTSHIRQGGLNELILTSDSVGAIERAGGRPDKDKHGMRNGEPYTFAELQRDTSYPTKDFVFKETFVREDGKYQNSHVNARMYYVDPDGKKHRTVGPTSPEYHLSMENESLKFHFEERTTMKSLVFDLVELHKALLATKEDILKVKASARGNQVYEMRGGELLHLNDPKHLAIFADIVQNHRNRVIQNLKDIHGTLEDPPSGNSSPRADMSPTHYSSVMSPYRMDTD